MEKKKIKYSPKKEVPFNRLREDTAPVTSGDTTPSKNIGLSKGHLSKVP